MQTTWSRHKSSGLVLIDQVLEVRVVLKVLENSVLLPRIVSLC